MKNGKPHKVPLSTRAMEILAEARKLHDGDLVFVNDKGKALRDYHISTRLLKPLRIDATTHGFRSSFRNWGEETNAASHAALERALAHSIHNQTEAAYNRTDLLEQRRVLMQAWANYLSAK